MSETTNPCELANMVRKTRRLDLGGYIAVHREDWAALIALATVPPSADAPTVKKPDLDYLDRAAIRNHLQTIYEHADNPLAVRSALTPLLKRLEKP
jgi:hypothetical protein